MGMIMPLAGSQRAVFCRETALIHQITFKQGSMIKMEFTKDTKFVTGSGTIVTMSEAVKRIAVFVEDSNSFTIDIGTDSQTTDKTKIVTAIVCCKERKGGIFFYHSSTVDKVALLRNRIYMETGKSVECANQLIDLFLENEMFYTISIHSDVGLNGKTRELISEITGFVAAYGYDCKIKPNSIAASTVADKLSK